MPQRFGRCWCRAILLASGKGVSACWVIFLPTPNHIAIMGTKHNSLTVYWLDASTRPIEIRWSKDCRCVYQGHPAFSRLAQWAPPALRSRWPTIPISRLRIFPAASPFTPATPAPSTPEPSTPGEARASRRDEDRLFRHFRGCTWSQRSRNTKSWV